MPRTPCCALLPPAAALSVLGARSSRSRCWQVSFLLQAVRGYVPGLSPRLAGGCPCASSLHGPSAVCAKSHTFLQHCHGQLTDAGTARPGIRSKPLIPLAAEIDERKWVKSQPAGKASPGAGKVWVRRLRPLGIKTSTLWRSHGLFPRPLLTQELHSGPTPSPGSRLLGFQTQALQSGIKYCEYSHHFASDLSPCAAHTEQAQLPWVMFFREHFSGMGPGL